jgi:hypothetical protein
MAKLKVYKADNGSEYRFVAATSIKKAAELLNTTVGGMRRYGHLASSKDAEVVLDDPSWIYERGMTDWNGKPERLSPIAAD